MKLDMRVISIGENPTPGGPTFSYQMNAAPDSITNKEVLGDNGYAQVVMGNIRDRPFNYGDIVTVDIAGGEASRVATAALKPGDPTETNRRVPSRLR